MIDFSPKIRFGSKCRLYENPYCGLAPSVTSITECLHKFALVQWAADCAVDCLKGNWPFGNSFESWSQEDFLCWFNEARTAYKAISKEATDTGTDIHNLCELYFRSFHDVSYAVELDKALAGADEVSNKMLKNLKTWCEENEIEPVGIERVLHEYAYSGRCDLIAKRRGKLGVWDIKTSKAYYPEMGLQLAAYAQAVFLEDCEWPQEIGIIRLDKTTGSCNCSEDGRGPHYTKDIDRLTKAFNALCEFYWEANDLRRQFNENNSGTSDREAGQRTGQAEVA